MATARVINWFLCSKSTTTWISAPRGGDASAVVEEQGDGDQPGGLCSTSTITLISTAGLPVGSPAGNTMVLTSAAPGNHSSRRLCSCLCRHMPRPMPGVRADMTRAEWATGPDTPPPPHLGGWVGRIRVLGCGGEWRRLGRWVHGKPECESADDRGHVGHGHRRQGMDEPLTNLPAKVGRRFHHSIWACVQTVPSAGSHRFATSCRAARIRHGAVHRATKVDPLRLAHHTPKRASR